VQIGSNAGEVREIAEKSGIFVEDGPHCRLALLADRSKHRTLGNEEEPPLINALHRAMILWKQEKRQDLLSYLDKHDLLADDRFWKLAQSLFDVLPRDLEDWKIVSALLGERQTLSAERRKATVTPAQRTLGLR
jgi:putative DNA methylase